MDFISVVVFLFLYYIRPHDWIPSLSALKPITLTMMVALGGMLIRAGGFSLSKLVETPIQRLMWIYLGWILFAAPDLSDTIESSKSAFLFFAATSLALSSPQRLETYLRAWMWALIIIATIAVLSLVGFDPTNSREATEATKGRLCINTWMHNNPNALGHSVVVAIPLLYFACFWRRPVGQKTVAVLATAIIACCVYFTESKGAFVVGFVVIVAAQLLGRTRIVQGIVLALAATFGIVAVTQLPRMETLNRNEAGIQGRLIAWEMARTAMKNNPKGVGMNRFRAQFRWEREWVSKATHSTYVQIGAELGYTGLFLYAAMFGGAFRTLLLARTRNEQEERIRRLLFVLLFAMFCSNFMKDMAFTAEFFLLMATVSAFHRMLRMPAEQLDAPALEAAVPAAEAELVPQAQLALAGIGGMTVSKMAFANPFRGDGTAGGASPQTENEPAQWPQVGIFWQKLGVVDAALGGLLFWVILAFWDHALKG